MAVLPWRTQRNPVIADAHACKAPSDGMTMASVAIRDEIGRLLPREGLGNLLRDPLRRRMVGHAERDQTSPFMPRMTNTDSSRKLIVGATRKSMAPIPAAWLRRNVFQVWPDPGRRLAMYLATVDCTISIPSFSSSPRMRGAPNSGFSTLIRRIKLRTSIGTLGRAPRERDFQRHRAGNPTDATAAPCPAGRW